MKRVHQILKGFEEPLEEIAQLEYVKAVIPGRIKRVLRTAQAADAANSHESVESGLSNPMCEFWRLKKEDGSRYLGKKMKIFESQEESHVDR